MSVCERNPVARITCRDAAFTSFIRPLSPETWSVTLSSSRFLMPVQSNLGPACNTNHCVCRWFMYSSTNVTLGGIFCHKAITCSPTDCAYGREPQGRLRPPGFICFSVHPHTHACGTLFHICARRSPFKCRTRCYLMLRYRVSHASP